MLGGHSSGRPCRHFPKMALSACTGTSLSVGDSPLPAGEPLPDTMIAMATMTAITILAIIPTFFISTP